MKLNGSLIIIGLLLATPAATAQSTSIGRRAAARLSKRPNTQSSLRHFERRKGNPTLEKHSLVAVKLKPTRKFKVNDLITIIIREQRKFESDAEVETKKDFNFKSTLNAFIKPFNGQIAAVDFTNGKPNIDFQAKSKLKSEADKDREDRFTTRITARIIDIKPNGNIVLEGRSQFRFENEYTLVGFTGTCRATDVSPDNTILSTQIADKNIVVQNQGVVRDGTRRGWIPRLVDLLRPI